LAIPVLLILAVLWAAVLVPPVLRSRSESRGGDMADFTARLGSVTGSRSSRRSNGSNGRRSSRSLHAVPEFRFAPARSEGVEGRPAKGTRRSAGQRRRRNVLMILGSTVIVSLLLVLVLGSPILWMAQVLADLMLAIYVSLLFLMRRRSLAAFQMDLDTWPPAPRSTGPVTHPGVPPRPELAPLSPAAWAPRRTAAR
jgi:Flp pilus assembly protein TadB